MSAVAAIELLVIFPRLLVGVLFRRNSLMVLLAYIGFLRVRWDQSLFVRRSLSEITRRIDGLVADPNIPSVLKSGWHKLKQFIGQYAGAAPAPQPGPASGGKKTT